MTPHSVMFRGNVQTIHFVGIGGIGMSGIAEVLLNLGFRVTGSDLRENDSVRRLRGLGATVHIGHSREQVGEADVVVRSTAVGEENVEVAAALKAYIPVIRRAEMLAELMRLKYGIAVAGTHGKTTTTSMLSECLREELDPTVVIGGRLDSLGGSNAKLGAGEYLVAEADESDGSFLYLSPTVALVTNIDPEHLDHHGTAEELHRIFLEFVRKVPFYGFAVLCMDHPDVQAMIPRIGRRVVTYGFSRQADYRASSLRFDGLKTSFRVHRKVGPKDEVVLGEITLGMPGRHNVQNALGAVAAAMELKVPFQQIREALHDFGGVQRRFTVRGDVGGVLVVDDYGHHPVEIEATLQAAEEAYPDRRIVAVFQPHRFSRLRDLWGDFASCFNRAESVLVCPVYAAGEAPIEGVDHEHIAAAIHHRGHRGTIVADDLDHATALLIRSVEPGDIVITLGAGNVGSVCGQLVAHLESVAT